MWNRVQVNVEPGMESQESARTFGAEHCLDVDLIGMRGRQYTNVLDKLVARPRREGARVGGPRRGAPAPDPAGDPPSSVSVTAVTTPSSFA